MNRYRVSYRIRKSQRLWTVEIEAKSFDHAARRVSTFLRHNTVVIVELLDV